MNQGGFTEGDDTAWHASVEERYLESGFPQRSNQGGLLRRRYCTPMHTEREKASTPGVLKHTTIARSRSVVSLVLSTREGRTHVRGTKEALQRMRHHSVLQSLQRGSPVYVST